MGSNGNSIVKGQTEIRLGCGKDFSCSLAFARVIKVAQVVNNLLRAGKISTKRDIYYLGTSLAAWNQDPIEYLRCV